jgi:hypothetical protein
MKRFAIFATMILALLLLPALAAGAAHCSLLPAKSAMPTPITKRQKIVDALKPRLAAIDSSGAPLADGYQYQTDVGTNPIDDWPTQYQEDELKAAAGRARLGIFDLVNTMTQSFPREKAIPNTLPLQVRIFHSREVTPAQVRVIIADVMRAVITDPATGQRDAQLGGLVVDMKPTEEGFIVPKETFQIDGAAVGFEVEFYAEPFNAYE